MTEVLIDSYKKTFHVKWRPVNPNMEGNLYGENGPLAKYDRAFSSTSLQHELANNVVYSSWQGHCDKAALVSALLDEPKRNVTLNGVNFTPDDIEGLLVKVIQSVPYETKWVGDRFPDNTLGEPRPSKLFETLRKWKSYHLPVLFDIVRSYQVWTYPYGTVRIEDGNVLVMKSDGFPEENKRIRFDPTSDTWIGKNPDFAWIPIAKQNLNEASAWPEENSKRMNIFYNPKISPANVFKLYIKSI